MAKTLSFSTKPIMHHVLKRKSDVMCRIFRMLCEAVVNQRNEEHSDVIKYTITEETDEVVHRFKINHKDHEHIFASLMADIEYIGDFVGKKLNGFEQTAVGSLFIYQFIDYIANKRDVMDEISILTSQISYSGGLIDGVVFILEPGAREYQGIGDLNTTAWAHKYGLIRVGDVTVTGVSIDRGKIGLYIKPTNPTN